MTADGLHTYVYDAESRLVSVDNGATAYAYGPEGERVAASSGGAVQEEYLYGLSGNLATTVDGAGNLLTAALEGAGLHFADYRGSVVSGNTIFREPDQVGSLLTTWDQTGQATASCLGAPFGGDLDCAPSTDYGETHFTDKKRDQATGLDYFGARYYGSNMGRFLTPDWSKNPEGVPYADLSNPQSLNLYSYVGNNPLSRADKDGHQEAIPTPLGPLPLFFPQQQITRQQAGQMALDIQDFISNLGQVLNEDAARIGAVGSAISNVFNADASAPDIIIDGNRHPESAQHVADAQAAGQPSQVTIDRANAKSNRADALRGQPVVPGKQRDEYPPAVTKEGGTGASVRPISPSDNAGSGASLGNQLRGVPVGATVTIKPVNVPRSNP